MFTNLGFSPNVATNERMIALHSALSTTLKIAPPPPGLGWKVVTLFQVFMAYGRFQGEMTEPAPYSKFSPAATSSSVDLSGRQGMLIAYAPASFVAAYSFLFSSGQQNLAALLLWVHFGKRLLEVLFIHKYSGTMSASTAATIGVYYALDTLLITSTSMKIQDVQPMYFALGVVLFAIGEIGNGYHHYLLARLRDSDNKDNNNKQQQRYVAPRGGLFAYVAAPHYFFELVAWLGVACAAQQVNAFLEVLSHTGYLMGRSHQTNQLYRKKFSDNEWPPSRKNIFPSLW